MNDKNISFTLNCDDVLLFNEDIIKINSFQEKMITGTREDLESLVDDIQESITEEPKLPIKYIKSNFSIEYQLINCQILQVNGKGWKKGNLNIEIFISLTNHQDDKVNLKFFPDEPTEPESPLDDIREMIQLTDGA